MNRITTILAVSFLFTTGLALARPHGFNDGERDGGNSGAWNNGGNSNNGSTDNLDNNDSHSGNHTGGGRTFTSPSGTNNGHSYTNHSSNGYWGRGQGGFHNNYNRSGGYNNYRSHNGWNRPSQGVHHFNSPNNSQAYRGFNSTGHHSYIPQSLRNMGVTRIPKPLTARAIMPSEFHRSVPSLPNHGPSGRTFSSSVVSPVKMNSSAVRTRMAAIAGSRTFMAKVAATTPTPGMRNHYYWHNWNGYNYCNYYDGYGNCWYGWNCGAGFFWSRYYCGNWWWYDPWWGNWCWWWGDHWWWENPTTTTVYVYNNGNYAPANTDNSNDAANTNDYGGPVYGDNTPQGQTPGDNGNAGVNSPSARNENVPVDFLSRDGKVKVTVSAQGDAFLYNLKNPKASKPVYLDSNVDEVKFSNSGSGSEKILLIFKDGSFSTFNSDGTPAEGAKT